MANFIGVTTCDGIEVDADQRKQIDAILEKYRFPMEDFTTGDPGEFAIRGYDWFEVGKNKSDDEFFNDYEDASDEFFKDIQKVLKGFDYNLDLDNITSNIGVTIGTSGNLVANLNGLNARITNHITTGNLTLRANVVGTIVNSLNIDGTTGNVEIVGNLNTSSNLRITNNLSASSAAFTNTLSADTLSITDTVTVNDLLTADKLATTTTTTLSGNIILDGAQVLTNGGVVSLNVLTSYFSTTAAWTATLLAGTAGQIKVLAMLADGGNMVITVTNPAWGGAGTLTFADVGDACTLQYIGSKWFVIGNNGVTIA
jgi:hypothetical protein